MTRSARWVIGAVLVAAACLGFPAGALLVSLPSGFQQTVAFSGLTSPTNFRFASDGRVFVAEKGGLIKVFPSLSSTTPTVVADLRTEVDDYWDRGLLGLALDPNFPASPYIYALYTRDAPIGGTTPTWNDACPSPPGPTTDGCVASGRLVKLTLSGNTATSTQVLVDGWCQQYPSHSLGDLNFGSDGALYVSGGEGASFTFSDFGQGGGSAGSPTPRNPCADPPDGPGPGGTNPPTAEGGALRAQSARRAAGEPVLLNGAVLRIDPSTGAGLPTNPLASSPDANARRLVAYGLRNPFRFTFRPGTSDLWIADVGWADWEEINRVPSPTAQVTNFGWPCYEGPNPQPGYQSANLNLCTSLYATGAAGPYFTWNHANQVVAGDGCPTGGSSVTGIAFYNGGSYPTSYNGSLFFADYTRNCMWVMRPGTNGLPDPTKVSPFALGVSNPVDLQAGPGGDLFYADLNGGTIRRISYVGSNTPPTAVATATPTSGATPLTVSFDGSGSSDPDVGDTLSYSWDLNADGVFGDSTVAKPTYTYTIGGTYAVKLKVTDSNGGTSTSSPLTITAAAPGTALFGTTTAGAFTDTASTDYKEVSRYTAVAGSVTKLTGYVSGLGPNVGSQSVRAVLYADAGGSPGALLAVSNAVTVVSGQQWGWVDFVLPAPVAVSAGPVWMGYIAGTNNDLTQLRYDSVTADLRYNANAGGFAAGPTSPFGTAVQASLHYSLYATVTTGPPPNSPPVATASATPTSGPAPLTVAFDGSASSDPDAGDTLTYAWDLDGDGAFDDAIAATPSYTYASAGTYAARLRVTDNHGSSATSSPLTITVSPGGTTGTFGTTTIGASTDLASADYKEVSRYTAVAGNVTKLTGYISGLGPNTGSQLVRAVMYADSGGNPGALLGVSNAVTVAAGQPWGWVDFVLPAPVAVSAGTIWMGYIAGSNNDLTQLRYDSVTGDLRYNANAGGYAAGAANPFGTAVQASLHYSLYATVTTSSNTPPVPAIAAPSSSLTWKVGDSISFSGGATDAQDGTEPAARLSWSVVLHHCPSTCHTHTVQTFAGVASGSLQAPDHDYPSYLELVLTATDAAGASASTSVNLQPQTVDLTFASSPTGASLTVGTAANVAPFTRTVIVGSSNSVSAPSQTIGGTAYTFTSWSDSGAQTHNLVAPATATTYTATFGTGPANTPPVAAATATPTSGTAPLTVAFDGSGSSDADAGDTLTYSWDLNGDGTFGDSFAINPSYTFATAGSYTPKLKVTDNHGASTTTSASTITVNPASTGGTFGTTTVGSSTSSATADLKTVTRYTALAGQVTKLTGYVSGLGVKGGSQPVRAVLYSDAGGRPGALLGVSNAVTIDGGRAWGWVDFALPSAVPVTGGTIWMGYIAGTRGGLTQFRYVSVNGDERHNKNSGGYAAGPSSPFGTSTTSNLHYSLYATYIP